MSRRSQWDYFRRSPWDKVQIADGRLKQEVCSAQIEGISLNPFVKSVIYPLTVFLIFGENTIDYDYSK